MRSTPSAASASARSGVRPSAYTRKIGSVPDGRTRTAPSASTIFTPSVVSTFRPFVSSTRDVRMASRLSTGTRSEEHTSELQSHHDLVCRLLLEKKKKQNITRNEYKLQIL